MRCMILSCFGWLARVSPVAGFLIAADLSSFAQQQTVFFSPLDPIYRPAAISGGGGYPGSLDYMELFAPNAAWVNAASHVQVFEPYGQWIQAATDAQLTQMFTNLANRHIVLGIEVSAFAFPTATGCGSGVESFQASGWVFLLQRIKDLGGDLQWVFFDNPLYYGSYYNGENACRWPLDTVLANLLPQVTMVKRIFPNVRIADIEGIAPADVPDWLDRLKSFIAMYRQANGSNFAALRVDAGGFVDPNWKDDIIAFSKIAAQDGIPFGIIYQGSTEQSSADWMNAARQRVLDYELHGGTPPDHVVFQSWTQYPEYSLPETDSSAFTSIINWYFRQRTRLSVNATSSLVTGKLIDSLGVPIPSAPIQVTAIPTAGKGVIGSYTITGTVPAGLKTALVGVRVNEECGCQGTNDITLYSFQYTQNSGSTPAATFDFANGLNGWGLGPGAGSLEPGPPPFGQGLHITAQPSQAVQLNSSTFPTTPGASFTLQITARVSPNSAGSGYFLIVFLTNANGTGESSRQQMAFQSVTIPLGSADTAADGSYMLSLPAEDPASYQIQASYAGTDALWPAFSSALVSITPSIMPNGLVNAADFKSEPLSPDAWFTIFGNCLGQAAQWTDPNTFSLGGASVSVCGFPAAISYNSGPTTTNGVTGWQLNALMPDSVAGMTSCPVTVSVNGQISLPTAVSIASGVLELFAFASTAGELPIITHADYSLVGPSSAGLSPAKPGEMIIGWGTGDCSNLAITAGGKPATIFFSGRTAPGLCQINFAVPDGLTGDNQLRISTSPNPYTLWVTQ